MVPQSQAGGGRGRAGGQGMFGQGVQDRAALPGDEERMGLGPEAKPEDKLAKVLRGLAEKVEKEGTDGALTVGKLKVVDYRVDVMVFLTDASAETLKKLEELGFSKTGESKAISLVIGSIDVRKLEALAELELVIRVKPVVSP
jgi:hypothetical protein